MDSMCGGFVGKLLGVKQPEVPEIKPPAPSPTVENNEVDDDTMVKENQRKKRGFSSTRTTDTLLSSAGRNKLG